MFIEIRLVNKMTTNGRFNDFYKQFEELNRKLDKANNTILNMSLTISELNDNNKKLMEKLEKEEKKNQELLLEIERLKNNTNKDSLNLRVLTDTKKLVTTELKLIEKKVVN